MMTTNPTPMLDEFMKESVLLSLQETRRRERKVLSD